MPPMPWPLFVVVSVLGSAAGAVLGVVRGLDYLPTLPVAVFEGAILIGVPATVLGLVLAGLWSLGAAVRRRI